MCEVTSKTPRMCSTEQYYVAWRPYTNGQSGKINWKISIIQSQGGALLSLLVPVNAQWGCPWSLFYHYNRPLFNTEFYTKKNDKMHNCRFSDFPENV